MGINLDYSVSVTRATMTELPQYIKDWHINTAEVVSTGGASDNYADVLRYIKSLNLTPVLDIEMDIWAGGQIQSPIGSFTSFLQSVKNAGWPVVSSEGGRSGDPSFIKGMGLGYINYNCDQCGLWKDIYTDIGTVMNLWECYYPSEVGYITNGASANKAKPNGVLAGAWRDAAEYQKCYAGAETISLKKFKGDNDILSNSINGVQPSYESVIDSLIALGCPVTRFDVWGGIYSSRAQNQACGFDTIVANLQKNHPPNPIGGVAPVNPVAADGSAPAECVINGLRHYFARGTDNALWHSSQANAAWTSLGGSLTSGVAAISMGTNALIFARGTDKALWYRTLTDAWQKLGGVLTSAPTVTKEGTTVTVCIRGGNTEVWCLDLVADVWGQWAKVGGKTN